MNVILKKRRLIYFIISLFFGLQNFEIKAQPSEPNPANCDPSCPNSVWVHTSKILNNFWLCPTCKITVWYYERYDSCTNCYEFIIEDWSWETDGNPTDPSCNICITNSQGGYSFLASWIKEQLLKFNPFTNDLLEGECACVKAGFISSCYQPVINFSNKKYPKGIYFADRCDGYACCLNVYRVCKVNGLIQKPELQAIILPYMNNCEHPCYPVCEDLFGI